MKLRNIFLTFKDQLPLSRMWKNLRNGRIYGLIHIRSHVNMDGKPKVMYNTKPTAIKAALSMEKKTGKQFGKWKCLHCDGYHIGKNRESWIKKDEMQTRNNG